MQANNHTQGRKKSYIINSAGRGIWKALEEGKGKKNDVTLLYTQKIKEIF